VSRDDDLIADFLLGEQEPDQRASTAARWSAPETAACACR